MSSCLRPHRPTNFAIGLCGWNDLTFDADVYSQTVVDGVPLNIPVCPNGTRRVDSSQTTAGAFGDDPIVITRVSFMVDAPVHRNAMLFAGNIGSERALLPRFVFVSLQHGTYDVQFEYRSDAGVTLHASRAARSEIS